MRRGQAFDTFKLMIAAVIAVAILGILLGILGTISVPGAGFDDTVKSMLQTSYSTPGVSRASTGDVTFSEGSIYPGSAFKQYTDGTTETKFKCLDAALCTPVTMDTTLTVESNFKAKIYVVCNLSINTQIHTTSPSKLCCVGVGARVSGSDCH